MKVSGVGNFLGDKSPEWWRRFIEAHDDPPSCPHGVMAGPCSICLNNGEAKMTKRVRIENADTSNFRVVVQVWDKGLNDAPDVLAKEIPLDYPTAMTGDDVYLTSTRYIVVKEVATPSP